MHHLFLIFVKNLIYFVFLQPGATKKQTTPEDSSGFGDADGVGMNVKSIVVVVFLMMLMLFAVHCTWVTSNAYSSPSIVLASYGHDGYVILLYSNSSVM